MESYAQSVPLRVAIQHGAPDILLLLLRYGASTEEDDVAPSPIEMLLSKLNEYEDQAQYPHHLLVCLKVLLRTIPSVYLRTPSHLAMQCGIESVSVYEHYPKLVEKCLLPVERSGRSPPELKHLCRCSVRTRLAENFALPHGIRSLQLPEALRGYLDLLAD